MVADDTRDEHPSERFSQLPNAPGDQIRQFQRRGTHCFIVGSGQLFMDVAADSITPERQDDSVELRAGEEVVAEIDGLLDTPAPAGARDLHVVFVDPAYLIGVHYFTKMLITQK